MKDDISSSQVKHRFIPATGATLRVCSLDELVMDTTGALVMDTIGDS
jgi:hypothetical protein